MLEVRMLRARSPDRVHAIAGERQRLDKWLWLARLVKTRRQAVRLVEGGYVRVDARRAEAASKSVGRGDVLTVALERQVRVLRMLAIAERRGPSREAQALFEDLSPERGTASPPAGVCLPKRRKGDSNAKLMVAERCVPRTPRGGME
jgi:ribosome-associated heat shock protein Hsp15